MKATITIDLDNEDASSFLGRNTVKVRPASVLGYIDECAVTDSGAIIDRNGNRIGSIEVSNE